MYTFYSSNGYYYPRSNWKDASVDKWLDQARTTVDPIARTKLYAQVAQRAYDQAPYMLVPAGIAFTILRDNIKGVSAATYNPMRSDATTGVLWKTLSKN